MPRGRPKGVKNKNNQTKPEPQTKTKPKEEQKMPEQVGKVTLPSVNTTRIEVQRSPLHVSASVGACFKTGRVGITSLSIQVEYEGDVTTAVDDVAQICNDEWERLQRKGLTQIVPDTYYEMKQGNSSAESSDKVEDDIPDFDASEPVAKPIEEEFNDVDLEPIDSTVQDVSTVADGEAALDEIQKTEDEFNAAEPIETPPADIGDQFDALAGEWEDDLSLDTVEDDAPNITEEVVEPEFNEAGEPLDESEKLDPIDKLGFDGADQDGFDVDLEVPEEKLEETNGKLLCVFDLSPDEQRAELTKRGVTEINGVPLDKADEPDILMTLDGMLEEEAE